MQNSVFGSDPSASSLLSSMSPKGRVDLSRPTFGEFQNISISNCCKKIKTFTGHGGHFFPILPFVSGHVGLCRFCGVTAEQQGGAALDIPAGMFALFLCTSESPQAQYPGLVCRDTIH